MNLATVRNIQGLHAPLKLQMEYRAARQVCLMLSWFGLRGASRLVSFDNLTVYCITFTSPAFSRSSGCPSCRAPTWPWTRYGASTNPSASRTYSTVRPPLQHGSIVSLLTPPPPVLVNVGGWVQEMPKHDYTVHISRDIL